MTNPRCTYPACDCKLSDASGCEYDKIDAAARQLQTPRIITIRPLVRPQFDNANLGNEGLWILDNSITLSRYWQVLGRVAFIDDTSDKDIDVFCREQHSQEVRQACGSRLPHGEGVL